MKYTYRGYEITQHNPGEEWVAATPDGAIIGTYPTVQDAISALDAEPAL